MGTKTFVLNRHKNLGISKFFKDFFKKKVTWSQLNCFILIKSDYIFHTKGWNNIKVSKENIFYKSLWNKIHNVTGEKCWNKHSTISIWSFLHSLLVSRVHENQLVPLKSFTFKEMVYLTVTVLLEHWVKCSSCAAHANSHGSQRVWFLSPLTWSSHPSHEGRGEAE